MNEYRLNRRDLIRATSVGLLGTAGASQITVAQKIARHNDRKIIATSDPLLQEDFEDYSMGSFPSGWSRSGNNNQQVVDGPVAHGDQALEMTGSYGGCWQALAHNEFVSEVPSDQTLVFGGHMRPTGTGSSGCHGNKNGSLMLQDSSASAGERDHRRKLIQFRVDGTVSGSGLDLGSCLIGEYNSFEITYHWDSSTETVDISYTINSENRGNTTVDATTDRNGTVVESELSYLTLVSGDYKIYIDDLLVKTAPPDNGDVSLTLAITDATAEAGGTATVTYILTNEGSAGSTGLQGRIDFPPGNWQLGESGSFTSLDPGESDSVSAEVLLPDSASGEYTIDGDVTDNAGNEASASATITVEETGEPEFEFTAEASPETVALGEETTLEFTITNVGDGVGDDLYAAFFGDEELRNAYPYQQPFEISSRDDDGGGWDGGWLYGPSFDSVIAPGETRMPSVDVTVTESAAPGEYTFALENINTDDGPAVATVTVTVAQDNTPPNASFTVSPEAPTVADTLTFDGSESNDPDGTIETYEWKVGDGDTFTPEGPEFTTELSQAGEMTVSLRVTDDDNATDTATQTVTVEQSPFKSWKEAHLKTATHLDELAVSDFGAAERASTANDAYTTAVNDEQLSRTDATEAIQRLDRGLGITEDVFEYTTNAPEVSSDEVDLIGEMARPVLDTALELATTAISIGKKIAKGLGLGSKTILKAAKSTALDAMKSLLMTVFGDVVDVASEVRTKGDSLVSKLIKESFETVDQMLKFKEQLVDELVETVSISLQYAMEQSLVMSPAVSQFYPDGTGASLSDGLAVFYDKLSVNTVADSGLDGSMAGALTAASEASSGVQAEAEETQALIADAKAFTEEYSLSRAVYDLFQTPNISNVIQTLVSAVLFVAGGIAEAFSTGGGYGALVKINFTHHLGLWDVQEGEVS